MANLLATLGNVSKYRVSWSSDQNLVDGVFDIRTRLQNCYTDFPIPDGTLASPLRLFIPKFVMETSPC